jgi:hypothetical protein
MDIMANSCDVRNSLARIAAELGSGQQAAYTIRIPARSPLPSPKAAVR